MGFEFDMGGAFGMIEDVGLSFDQIHGAAGSAILAQVGGELSELLKKAVPEFDHIDTGQLRDSIRPTGAKESSGGVGRYVDVYPHDSRKRGNHKTRNAEIGFYLEHGVTRTPPGKSIPASHWMSNTVDDCAEDILDIMENAISEIIDKNTGG